MSCVLGAWLAGLVTEGTQEGALKASLHVLRGLTFKGFISH